MTKLARSENAPRRLRTLSEKQRVLKCRIEGMTIDEIADATDIPRSTVHDLLKVAVGELHDDVRALAETHVTLELARLDSMLVALQPKIEEADCRAIEAALKIAERRAKLLGLDKPTRVEHSGTIALDSEGLMALLDALPVDDTDDPSPQAPLAN